tara:strand:- start:151 stop:387 length:237 start_codon:yes stop_codon:yes gene_type:complete
MQEIKLSLTIDNVNLILEGLGSMPSAKLFNVVATIQQQAQEQIRSAEEPPAEVNPKTAQAVSDAEAIPAPKRAASAGK